MSTAAALRPHLLADVYGVVFDKLLQGSEFDRIGKRCHCEMTGLYTCLNGRLEATDFVIQLALTGKVAFRRFVQLFREIFELRFRRKGMYLHDSHRNTGSFGLPTFLFDLARSFYKFITKATFFKIRFGDGGCDGFVKCLEDMVDLRHIDMSGKHEIDISVLQKMGKVFAKVVNFNIDAATFLLLLSYTDFSFPELERLKVTGRYEHFNRMVTPSERFPKLEFVDINSRSMSKNFKELARRLRSGSGANISADRCVFVETDLAIVKYWLTKFPSLNHAEITIVKFVAEYPHTNHGREDWLHAAFRSFDFGVPLDLAFRLHSSSPSFWAESLQDRLSSFDYDDQHNNYVFFTYKDVMPTKTFEHSINLRWDTAL
uniref:F-box domain-containing protein n=1 Tax=Panagrellus redivivus TaxID=6233 RepID=A0A7E4V7W0_PANRE